MTTRNPILTALVVATVLSVAPMASAACEGISLHTDGACEAPGDVVTFEVEVLDDTLHDFSVEWGSSDAGLELTCDPPDDPLCLRVAIPCPDCASDTSTEEVSVYVHVMAPDDVSVCWAFIEFRPCSGDEDDSVGTSATLCQVPQEDGAGANNGLVLATCVIGGVFACRRHCRGRRGGP